VPHFDIAPLDWVTKGRTSEVGNTIPKFYLRGNCKSIPLLGVGNRLTGVHAGLPTRKQVGGSITCQGMVPNSENKRPCLEAAAALI